jgi:phosphate:Na+ symporter
VGWIIATLGFSISIEAIALPGLGISTIAMFLFKPRKNVYNSFRTLFAISLLFFGLGYMKESADVFVKEFDISSYSQQPLIVFLLIGVVITSIVQTSSATMAITLTALYSKAIPFDAAAAVIIGSEVGTSVKTILAGIRGSGEKKRAAYGNFYFNIVTAIVAFSFLPLLIRFITDVAGIRDPLIGLAFFQSMINVIAILIFLPVIELFSKWLQRMFTRNDVTESFSANDLKNVDEPNARLVHDEVFNLLEKDLEFHDIVFDINTRKEGFLENVKSFTRVSGFTNRFYNQLKLTEGEIQEYYARTRQDEINKSEAGKMDILMETLRQIMHSAKSVKDIHHNITEMRESVKDIVHEHYFDVQDNWNNFRDAFREALSRPAQLDKLMREAHEDVERQNEKIREELNLDQLDEVDASTLFNIAREILSSKKALIRAAENLV